MILYGDLTYDSRVRKEARTFALAGDQVTIVCLADASDRSDLPKGVTVLVRPTGGASVTPGALNPFRAASRSRSAAVIRGVGWLRAYIRALRAWGRWAVTSCGPVDLWHANDLIGLAAIAPFVDRGEVIVYDVHDLILDTGTAVRLPVPVRALLRWYERRLVSKVAAIVTVNAGLAGILRQRFPGKRVEIVHNCPDRWSPPDAQPTLIRDALGVGPEVPILLYHGGLSANRGIEELMDAMRQPGLESAHLVLLGFGERRDAFKQAASDPVWQGRVHILDAVPPSDLLSWVASADIGAVVHPGTKLNDRHKTPNKLFECIAAGVPVVVSDFPLMRRIALDGPTGPLGSRADPASPESIGAAIRSLLALEPHEMAILRERCRTAARTIWNWETESARLIDLYATVIDPSHDHSR